MRKNKLLIALGALTLVMACLPTAGTPFPTPAPGEVNTFIAQTAEVASTQTAVAMPASETPSPTRKPTLTKTTSPTPTITFVFLLPGLGPTGSATLPGISNGTTNSKYGCSVLSTEPADDTVFAPRDDFVVTWGVKNIGRETWYRATMKYSYYNGAKLHKVASYTIPKGVEPGKNVFLTAEMSAFKEGGTYTTKWALNIDNTYFCPMTITIIVK